MLLSMNIIPIVNENDAVSTTDIELEDNYPLALKIANITGADIIVIKSQENGNYGIVTGNEKPVIQVENEISLQEKIDALFGRNASSAVFPATVVFPATMNEISSL
jgi:glutamate 5-kinase